MTSGNACVTGKDCLRLLQNSACVCKAHQKAVRSV